MTPFTGNPGGIGTSRLLRAPSERPPCVVMAQTMARPIEAGTVPKATPSSSSWGKPLALLPRSQPQVTQYSLRSLASLEHGGHHQIRAAHHVASGEYLGIGPLKFG